MSVALPLTIPNSFARNAHWFGGGDAVVDSSTRLTYADLDALSLRAASLFAQLGAEPGKPLALLCPPSAIYLVAWLGAVRLGALPMALHTRESAATLAAICRKMRPNVLVYDVHGGIGRGDSGWLRRVSCFDRSALRAASEAQRLGASGRVNSRRSRPR